MSEDFEIVDAFAEHHDRYGVGVGDTARVRLNTGTERPKGRRGPRVNPAPHPTRVNGA
jgi:hypothetical protein